MNDETYTFIETVQQRGDIGKSAFRKGKRKGCMLPHEYMTRKELNKMNSEVKTINLDKPMKWSEFKALDADIQKQYIKRLRDIYNVNNNLLADMFGIHYVSLNKMFRIMGLTDDKKHRMTWQQKCSFEAFCSGDKTEPVVEEKPVDIPEEPAAAPETQEVTKNGFEHAIPAAMFINEYCRDDVLETEALVNRMKEEANVTDSSKLQTIPEEEEKKDEYINIEYVDGTVQPVKVNPVDIPQIMSKDEAAKLILPPNPPVGRVTIHMMNLILDNVTDWSNVYDIVKHLPLPEGGCSVQIQLLRKEEQA